MLGKLEGFCSLQEFPAMHCSSSLLTPPAPLQVRLFLIKLLTEPIWLIFSTSLQCIFRTLHFYYFSLTQRPPSSKGCSPWGRASLFGAGPPNPPSWAGQHRDGFLPWSGGKPLFCPAFCMPCFTYMYMCIYGCVRMYEYTCIISFSICLSPYVTNIHLHPSVKKYMYF